MHLQVPCQFCNRVSGFSVTPERVVHHQEPFHRNWPQCLLFNKWERGDLKYKTLAEWPMGTRMRHGSSIKAKDKGKEPMNLDLGNNDKLAIRTKVQERMITRTHI